MQTATITQDRSSFAQRIIARIKKSRTLKVFVQNRLATAGMAIIAFMILFCFVGPEIYRTQQTFTNLSIANQPPSLAHPLGTTPVGYDVLGRLMIGGQTSLEIGISAALIATIFGAAWGAIAGYAGGIIDSFMMRIVDSFLSIPALFLLLVLASITTTNMLELIIVIAIVSWLVPARLIRGETLSIKTRDFVQAARTLGAGPGRAIFRHIIPNAIGTIVVNTTFQIADAILAVAYLSFLGLGLPAPATNWGSMLSDGLNYAMDGYWWLTVPPGLAILLTVISFNLIGDALRDSLEIRLQGR